MKQYPCVKKQNTKTCTMYHINIQELCEYLINNKFYKPVEEEINMFSINKKSNVKDNNQNTDKVTQLEDEIKRIEIVKEDMAEQIKYLQLQLEKYEEEKMHNKPVEIEKKPTKKVNKKTENKETFDFVQISDTIFLNNKTGKEYEVVADNDMIDDEPF